MKIAEQTPKATRSETIDLPGAGMVLHGYISDAGGSRQVDKAPYSTVLTALLTCSARDGAFYQAIIHNFTGSGSIQLPNGGRVLEIAAHEKPKSLIAGKFAIVSLSKAGDPKTSGIVVYRVKFLEKQSCLIAVWKNE